MIDVSKYIGKSYSEHSCYSLFVAIQKDLGYNLSDGAPELDLLQRYERLDKPVEGCAVLITENGLPTHIATYIGEGKIVHSTKDTGVVITDLVFENVYGYYGVRK